MIRHELFLLVVLLCINSCNDPKPPDLELAKQEILELHRLQRDYHFNKDSIAFANQLSDDFISVNKGVVSTPKRSETIARYNNYFSSVEFLEWDDVSEPIIRFSEDGTLAYTIVDKIVKVKYESENGEPQEGETHFAWTAIYRKIGKEWKIENVTSTNK
ncbi:MAG: nuclear transport factor 2 family protein [Bacteroidota bacterium]